MVVGTPLDFRLGYGVFGGKDGATPAQRGARGRLRRAGRHARRARRVGVRRAVGLVFDELLTAVDPARPVRPAWSTWVDDLRAAVAPRRRARRRAADGRGRPDPPCPDLRRAGPATGRRRDGHRRRRRLRLLRGQVRRAEASWRLARPGPYGCLGAGLGAAIAARLARPSAQVTLLLGDGAAGFSLMDVDTLVRHHLPVVMVWATTPPGGWRRTRCRCSTGTTSPPTSPRRPATTRW